MSLVMVSRLAACTVSRRGPLPLVRFLPFPVTPLPVTAEPFALDDTLVSSHLTSSPQDGWRFGDKCRLGICGCGVSRPTSYGVVRATTPGATGAGPAMTGIRGATAMLAPRMAFWALAAEAAKMASAATAPA